MSDSQCPNHHDDEHRLIVDLQFMEATESDDGDLQYQSIVCNTHINRVTPHAAAVMLLHVAHKMLVDSMRASTAGNPFASSLMGERAIFETSKQYLESLLAEEISIEKMATAEIPDDISGLVP